MNKADVAKAIRSYGFLRRAESTLRRFENKNVSTLPATPEEQRKLAVRLGSKSLEQFAKDYDAARKSIRVLYEAYIKARL